MEILENISEMVRWKLKTLIHHDKGAPRLQEPSRLASFPPIFHNIWNKRAKKLQIQKVAMEATLSHIVSSKHKMEAASIFQLRTEPRCPGNIMLVPSAQHLCEVHQMSRSRSSLVPNLQLLICRLHNFLFPTFPIIIMVSIWQKEIWSQFWLTFGQWRYINKYHLMILNQLIQPEVVWGYSKLRYYSFNSGEDKDDPVCWLWMKQLSPQLDRTIVQRGWKSHSIDLWIQLEGQSCQAGPGWPFNGRIVRKTRLQTCLTGLFQPVITGGREAEKLHIIANRAVCTPGRRLVALDGSETTKKKQKPSKDLLPLSGGEKKMCVLESRSEPVI